jgi:hypothetical protein
MTKILKNIIRGAGSVIELAPNRSRGNVKAGRFYSAESDQRSISRDWFKVGQDIRSAANTVLETNDKAAK